MNAPLYLRIPLSLIDYVDDVDAFQGLSPQQVAVLQRDYTPEEVDGIVDALRWASDHPDFDFASMIPGSSSSNAQMRGFLAKLLHSLEAAGLASKD